MFLSCLQVCAGQRSGCEAAIHAMRDIFSDSHTEGALLVDASNAFNSLNRRTALLNMFHLCPQLAITLNTTLIVMLLPYSLMVTHFGCLRAPLMVIHWLFIIKSIIGEFLGKFLEAF